MSKKNSFFLRHAAMPKAGKGGLAMERAKKYFLENLKIPEGFLQENMLTRS